MLTFCRAKSSKADGTSLTGYLRLSKNVLRDLIGLPDDRISGDGKVLEHYTLVIGGAIVTIYDYKTRGTKLPMTFSEWHVGGHIPGSIYILNQWLIEKGFETTVSSEQLFPTIKCRPSS